MLFQHHGLSSLLMAAVLLLLSPVAHAQASCPLPADIRTLRRGLTMREVINPSDQTITIQMIYEGEAWLGWGLNPDGEMIGGDAVIGLPDLMDVQQYDMSSESMRGVTPWSTQTLSNASITQVNGITALTFTMPLFNSGQHKIRADGPNTFIYAYGRDNDLGVHARASYIVVDEALHVCDPTTGTTLNNDGTVTTSTTATDGTSSTTSGTVTVVTSDTSAPVDTLDDDAISGGTTTTTPSTQAPADTTSSNGSSSCPLPQGSRTLTSGLTMREVYNPSTKTITVEMTYDGEAWIGFGVNPNGEMIGGDAVIGLPDTGDVQQYDMTAEKLSGVTPWSTQTLSHASIVQADGRTTLTFTMPLANDGQNEILADGPNTFIYAIGYDNELGTHARAKSFTIDTTLQECDAVSQSTPNYDGSSSSSAAGDESESESSVNTKKLWMAHGLLLSISWGVLVPLAIGCSVFRDSLGQGGLWFTLHSNLNNLVVLTTTAGFAIAVYILGKEGDRHFSGERHNKLGLVVFLMLFVQAASGWFRPKLPKHDANSDSKLKSPAGEADMEDGAESHYRHNINSYETESAPPKKSVFRVIFEFQHRILGMSLLGLSWYQVYLGIELYDDEFGLRINGTALFFGVAFAITGLIVLGKVGLVIKSRR